MPEWNLCAVQRALPAEACTALPTLAANQEVQFEQLQTFQLLYRQQSFLLIAQGKRGDVQCIVCPRSCIALLPVNAQPEVDRQQIIQLSLTTAPTVPPPLASLLSLDADQSEGKERSSRQGTPTRETPAGRLLDSQKVGAKEGSVQAIPASSGLIALRQAASRMGSSPVRLPQSTFNNNQVLHFQQGLHFIASNGA